jgi:hypothetical protein
LELQLEDKEEAEKVVAVAVAAATKAAKRLDFFIGMMICLEFKLLKFLKAKKLENSFLGREGERERERDGRELKLVKKGVSHGAYIYIYIKGFLVIEGNFRIFTRQLSPSLGIEFTILGLNLFV